MRALRRVFLIEVPVDGQATDTVALTTAEGASEFEAALGELIPAVSPVTDFRLKLAADRVVGEIIGELKVAAAKSIRARGY
jgi:hypothetical protein